jgi:N-acetylmuramoyl-L-alanine amidase
MYNNIAISSGHGKLIRGASGILDEVDEARKVVDSVAEILRSNGVVVEVFHDDTSTTQSENLETIVDWHNAQNRQLDISVHFNAYVACSGPMGTECLYKSQSTLASKMSLNVATGGGFINRGAKKRTDLFFLNQTEGPAILIEVCFVDSQADADLYFTNYDSICHSISLALHEETGVHMPKPLFIASGKMSWFGGPTDTGVKPEEGLAFIYKIEDAPHLFLPYQPSGTTGLARRLNEHVHFIACRWDYAVTPTKALLTKKAKIRTLSGKELTAFPADWGPHSSTGRVADLSKGLMEDLGLSTDDEVEVIFPA